MATKAHVVSMSAFRDNTAEHRYELDASDGKSFAEYRDLAGVRVILHVETPVDARGKGYASALMKHIVNEARSTKRRLRASCAFAVAYFRRHPDTADVQA
ncbi:MAG: N-acetyltransferase [Hyphomonadaceae bacterium]|nr:N-acetyltransferase [Hyphomonadaceae bacterium]